MLNSKECPGPVKHLNSTSKHSLGEAVKQQKSAVAGKCICFLSHLFLAQLSLLGNSALFVLVPCRVVL